jgi:uncharacterized repeat protein (TIGR01451 family)
MSKKCIFSKLLNGAVLLALLLSLLPAGPALSQAPAATPDPPQASPPGGAIRFAPPEAAPPESAPGPQAREVTDSVVADATTPAVPQSPEVCSGPAKIPFGQDLEIMLGPVGSHTTTRFDQDPVWSSRAQVSYIGPITNSTSSCPTNPGPEQVLVYQHSDYGGTCAILIPGQYPKASNFGLSNDSLSSIKVGSNVYVRLYRDSEFSGDTFDVSSSLSKLGDYDWDGTSTSVNDRTSSIKVWLKPRTYATAAVPLGTDAALVVMKTDSASGELAAQSWVADRGWGDLVRLGLSTSANPVLLARTPMDYTIFARSGTKIKARHASNRVLDPDWQEVPGVNDAASDPAVVAASPYHMVLFYRTSAGVVKYTEWESGVGWRNTPISLGKPTGTTIASELSAVAREETDIAVFGVSANNRLWVKTWSIANESDWSDTTWAEVTGLGSVKIAKPAVVSRHSAQMGVAVLNTSNAIKYKEWTYESGWKATVSISGYVEPLGLAATSGEEMFMYGVNSAGQLYTRRWTAAGGWEGWSAGNSGWTANTPMAAVVGRPHNLMLLGRGSSNYLQYRQYSNTGRGLVQTTLSNPTYGVQRGQAIATVNGRTAWVSAWRGNEGKWVLAARDTATWSGTYIFLDDPVPSASTDKVSLTTADLDEDGNDEIILGTLNGTGTSMRLSVYRLTHSGSAVTAITRAAYRDISSGGPRWNDVQVAVGDVDGDGVRDEVVIGALWMGYIQAYIRMYKGAGLSYKAQQNKWIGASLTDDLEMAIGQLDGQTGEQVVLATWGGVPPVCSARMVTLRYDSNTGTFSEVYSEQKSRMGFRVGAYSSALAVGDIDSDGLDEVIHARGLEVVAADILQSGAVYTSSMLLVNYYPSLAVGDVDGDGRAEIVYSDSGSWTTILKKMDISSDLLSLVGMHYATGVPLLADLDGDSAVATFKRCDEFSDVRVLGVTNSYPVWYDDDGESLQYTGGGMANSSTATTGEEDGWKVSLGGSVTVGVKQDLTVFIKIGEVRASVTQEFMGSFGGGTSREESVSESDGYDFGTMEFAQGGVCYTKTSYKCYEYEIAKPGSTDTTTAMSCVPVVGTGMPQQWCSTLDNWYSPAFRAEAGSSWAPIGHHPPNTTTLSVDLGWPNNYPVLTKPPVDPFRVWWQKSTSVGVQGDIVTGSPTTWSVEKSSGTTTMKTGSFEENTTVSAGFDLFAFSMDASLKAGYGKEWSSSVGWEEGLEFTGSVYAFPTSCQGDPCKSYGVVPYVYEAQAVTNAGVRYSYLEQDYYVSWMGTRAQAAAEPQSIVGLAPQAPVITSTTHPDPATWYPTSTLVLSWGQPAGDPAVVAGYKWNLNQTPVATPTTVIYLTTTQTYQDLADGVYYLHVQAMADGGDLSPVTHRAVRVDRSAPQVELVFDPSVPDGFDGWYNTPVTVSVAATDTTGSGVASIEISADGAIWQPYTTSLQITDDTPGVALWARATDDVSHTSEPISTTVKLDQTPPTTLDSDGYGLSYASIITDEVGNAQLVLGGALSDTLSGRLQVEVKAGDTGTWNPVSAVGDLPIPPGNEFTTTMTSLHWIYTPTFEIRGVYPLWARGVDAAGNYEADWIHGAFWWEPDDVPELIESQVSVSLHQANPGDVMAFTVGARNSGYQEAQLLVTNTVPAGLTIVPDSISDEGQYDTDTRVITWTLHALWPGQTRYLFFEASADETTSPITLENRLDLMAYWPWDESLYGVPPEPARHYYSTTTTLTVLPGADQAVAAASASNSSAPHVLDAAVAEGDIVSDPQVTLVVNASPDTRFLYVKEWVWDADLNEWSLANESGWVPFEAGAGFELTQDASGKYGRYEWTLSEGDGVKYLGIWVADANGQTSNVNEGNMIYTNRMSVEGQQLAAGQRVQYRVGWRANDLAILNLVSLSGDADLYVWKPRAGFMPHYYSNATPTGVDLPLDTVGFFAPEEGMYVIEVQALTDAYYRLVTAGSMSMAGSSLAETRVNPAWASLTEDDVALLKAQDEMMRDAHSTLTSLQSTHLPLAEKDRPAHPLTLSTPYRRGDVEMLSSAPQVPTTYPMYLPLIIK